MTSGGTGGGARLVRMCRAVLWRGLRKTLRPVVPSLGVAGPHQVPFRTYLIPVRFDSIGTGSYSFTPSFRRFMHAADVKDATSAVFWEVLMGYRSYVVYLAPIAIGETPSCFVVSLLSSYCSIILKCYCIIIINDPLFN